VLPSPNLGKIGKSQKYLENAWKVIGKSQKYLENAWKVIGKSQKYLESHWEKSKILGI